MTATFSVAWESIFNQSLFKYYAFGFHLIMAAIFPVPLSDEKGDNNMVKDGFCSEQVFGTIFDWPSLDRPDPNFKQF